jgi:hypothetical protein
MQRVFIDDTMITKGIPRLPTRVEYSAFAADIAASEIDSSVLDNNRDDGDNYLAGDDQDDFYRLICHSSRNQILGPSQSQRCDLLRSFRGEPESSASQSGFAEKDLSLFNSHSKLNLEGRHFSITRRLRPRECVDSVGRCCSLGHGS